MRYVSITRTRLSGVRLCDRTSQPIDRKNVFCRHREVAPTTFVQVRVLFLNGATSEIGPRPFTVSCFATGSADDSRMSIVKPTGPIKGRGAASRPAGRFEVTRTVAEDDGWAGDEEEIHVKFETIVTEEMCRSIISRNDSPDVGFSQSINQFRGCEHGCVYCFARPSHSYLNLSPGLDFETKLFAKSNAVEVLRRELSRPGYKPSPIALGINTDSYQPIERRYGLTRSLLEVLEAHAHPVSFVTKSALILRDVDLLARMAKRNLVNVHLSVTSLDNRLSAKLEPRAAAPHSRIRTIRELSEAGVPVGVLVAPVIPAVTDSYLEHILEAARDAGARSAGYVLIRLPHELKEIWREWLSLHFPDRAEHVMSLIQQMHGGKVYNSAFGARMRGTGPFADLLKRRFEVARKRIGYERLEPLNCNDFAVPPGEGFQPSLF
jgi:DNA repair photolyase